MQPSFLCQSHRSEAVFVLYPYDSQEVFLLDIKCCKTLPVSVSKGEGMIKKNTPLIPGIWVKTRKGWADCAAHCLEVLGKIGNGSDVALVWIPSRLGFGIVWVFPKPFSGCSDCKIQTWPDQSGLGGTAAPWDLFRDFFPGIQSPAFSLFSIQPPLLLKFYVKYKWCN